MFYRQCNNCNERWEFGMASTCKCPDETPKHTFVGLTKKEFQEAVEGLEDLEDCWVAIESALRSKNT